MAMAEGDIVTALRDFPASEDASLAAKSLLAFIKREDAQAACDANAVPTIVSAMRVHAGDVEVERNGCGALAQILSLPAGQQTAIDADAPAAIVSAMRTHTGDIFVATMGCTALGRISRLPAG